MSKAICTTDPASRSCTNTFEAALLIREALVLSLPTGSHNSAPTGFKSIEDIIYIFVGRGMPKEQALIIATAGAMIAHGRLREGFKVGDYVRGAEGVYGVIVNEWRGEQLKKTPSKTHWVKLVPSNMVVGARQERRKQRGLPPLDPMKPWEYEREDWVMPEDIPEVGDVNTAPNLALWHEEQMSKVRGEFGSASGTQTP